MKKYLLTFYLVLLVTTPDFSQVKITNYTQSSNKLKFSVELSSLPAKIIANTKKAKIVSFNGFQNESNPGGFALPSRELIIALPAYSHVSVNLTPVGTKLINGVPQRNSLPYLRNDSTVAYNNNFSSVEKYQVAPSYEIKGYLWIKNYYCLDLKINQYRYNNSDIIEELNKVNIVLTVLNPNNSNFLGKQPKSITSENELSDLIANYSEAKQLNKTYYESKKLATNDGWIDFNSEYVKIGTPNDGIYRITPNDLDNLGIQSSTIDPSTLKLFCKGAQVPIFVYGESDGQFNTGDYIEFVGKRNWGDNYRETSGPNESYKEYLNRYSDTTIYWLTWGGTAGDRVDTSSLVTGLAPDTLDFHYEVVHYEENVYLAYSINSLVDRQDPDWLTNETWVWAQQGVGTVNRTFIISDPYPGKTARAFYKVQDYASDVYTGAHKIGLSINNDPTVYDSSSFNKYDQKVVKAVFSSNLLTNGTNTLKTISFPTNASLNSIAYDWYEVEYPRYNKATNDSIYLDIMNDTFKTWTTVKITNVNSNNIVIYRTEPNTKKIINYNKIGTTLYFDDSVSVGNKYLVYSTDRISSPVFYYKKQFTDLSSSSNQADYILITAPEFVNKANEYTQFIGQSYNVTTKVINVNDIYDQYNFGFFAPEPIKTFLQAANLFWQSPKPTYLFLVGDANYDYYGNDHKYFGAPIVRNIVPSYGHPVSDEWFVIWDSTSLVPQMDVGRIPSNTVANFEWYLTKHKKYLSDPYDQFNKTYLLISSGDASNPSELQLLKNTNDYISDNIIKVPPTGGNVNHLYKTVNPVTNFGPYTDQQLKEIIGEGGLFISYIGHSGTQIWDNGINNIGQLKNNSGKEPLISDWGCSTGKFAEPDIKAFGELFINEPDGQAIGYTGNSSLGFVSTATLYPKLFYSELLQKNASSIGEAHRLAKMELLNTYGNTGVYRIFDLCNVLLGDPIVKLKVPQKPNLVINSDDVSISSNNVDDSEDSVEVKVDYFNYGRVDTSSFVIKVTDILDNNEVFSKSVIRDLPLYKDSLIFYILVKDLAGNHKIIVTLDGNNQIDELSKSDNTTEYDFIVQSSSLKALVETNNNSRSNGNFIFINPVKSPVTDSILVEYADNPAFTNSLPIVKELGTLMTGVSIPNLTKNKRYWVRWKLNLPSQKYSGTISFIYDDQNVSKYSLADSTSFLNLVVNNLFKVNDLSLLKTRKDLKVQTAGYYDGNYCVITVNGVDYVTRSNDNGHHILVFDENTLSFEYEVLLNYYLDTQNFQTNYINAIDSIPNNKIIVIGTTDDASGGVNSTVKNELKSIGSTKIDSVTFRSTWGIITKKNYTPGHVLEGYSPPYNGPVVLDTVITINHSEGNATTEEIGPASKWNSLDVNSYVPVNSSIICNVIGVKKDQTIDTLSSNILNGNLISLSQIDAKLYPFLKLNFKFISNDTTSLPALNSVDVNYIGVPELGTNYQLVHADKDSLIIGQNINLNFSVMNVGESEADSFKVKVEVVHSDNSKEEIMNTVSNLSAGGKKDFNINYTATSNVGQNSFLITIDPDNKITELFKYNNFYSVPFYVKGDTNKPSVNLTFDGREIIDNDFVSDHPKIKIELNDPSLLPVTDTSAISIKLDNEPVYYATSSSILTYRFNSTNPKMIVEYSPELGDGSHSLTVSSMNSLSVKAPDVNKNFAVSSEPKILDLYNYPNPFSGDTYFTFKLTQIPDQLKIRIFTIAGRLIKQFTLNPSNLKYDFNRIYWDGRDADGDPIANGIYLYKVIMSSKGKVQSLTQKLAVVR